MEPMHGNMGAPGVEDSGADRGRIRIPRAGEKDSMHVRPGAAGRTRPDTRRARLRVGAAPSSSVRLEATRYFR
jgi:hypothetical protein